MLKNAILMSCFIILSACIGASSTERKVLSVYHIEDGRQTSLAELVPDLMQQRIIIVGEHHTNKNHHFAQLRVIQALKEAGAEVVIGLEMFRSDSQENLNRWVSGELNEPEFREIYFENWNFPWEIYQMIFDYARQERIPMIGLNVPREITGQVARKGFDSLSDQQRGKLSNVTCRVDKIYMDYIRRAFGAHGHGKMDFTYFCEAQLVWDTIMALNAVEFLKANPETIVVLLCGAGHAQKGAIPRQIRNRSSLPHVVLLPESPDSITIDTVTAEDADYVIRVDK